MIIVNPAAGGGRAGRFWPRCASACEAAGLGLEVIVTARRGDAANAAAQAGDRVVIAVGGDGTANEVVNGLLRRGVERRPRLGVLSCGTGADLVRTLPGPRRPEHVPAWLQTGRWRTIDAGRVGTSMGRRYFVNAADVGIGAEIVRRAARGPAFLGGTLNFLGAAVLSLLVHRNADVQLCLDAGVMQEVRVRTIAVANGAYVGGGMWIAPDARPDDGLFEVVVIGDLGRFEGIRSLPLLYRGQHGRIPKVQFARARRVEIAASDPVGIEADGELIGTTPAVFEMVPAALDVLDWKG